MNKKTRLTHELLEGDFFIVVYYNEKLSTWSVNSEPIYSYQEAFTEKEQSNEAGISRNRIAKYRRVANE